MGLFWDLMQQNQISAQRNATETLEERVVALENQLRETQRTQRSLLELLEKKFGQDIDGDGKMG